MPRIADAVLCCVDGGWLLESHWFELAFLKVFYGGW
jgi:hypothetical protein